MYARHHHMTFVSIARVLRLITITCFKYRLLYQKVNFYCKVCDDAKIYMTRFISSIYVVYNNTYIGLYTNLIICP